MYIFFFFFLLRNTAKEQIKAGIDQLRGADKSERNLSTYHKPAHI
jgi:hypothetical protein